MILLLLKHKHHRMNSNGTKLRLAFILLFGWLSIQLTQAQIVVSPASSARGDDTQGFYYALPRHAIKVDLIVEKTQKIKGPYSDYASRILGVESFVKQDETVFNILDAVITTVLEPDPTAWFFVEFDERGSKDARSLVFDLHKNGLILAVDDSPLVRTTAQERIEKTLVNAGAEQYFNYYAERNIYQRIDTIVRRITIDTTVIRRNVLQSSWVDRNPEQKARAAADFIQKIRDERFNLLIGFQEVNYGQSIAYMDQQLRLLEQEYLSLFLGAETKTLVDQTIYYYPSDETKGIQNIARFSETAGLVTENVKGESIQLVVDPIGITGNLREANKNNGRSRISNGVYYRVPDAADLSLMYKGKLITTTRATLSQMGFIGVLPVNKTRMQFDPQSGMVTTIKRE